MASRIVLSLVGMSFFAHIVLADHKAAPDSKKGERAPAEHVEYVIVPLKESVSSLKSPKGKNDNELNNLLLSSSEKGVLFKTSGAYALGYIDSDGRACTSSPCVPLDIKNPVEKVTLEELAEYLQTREDLKDKSPYKEFLAWMKLGMPPTSEDKPAVKLVIPGSDDKALDVYNKKIQDRREQLDKGLAKEVNDYVKEIEAVSKISDPKEQEKKIGEVLHSMFTDGLEAPEPKTWSTMVGDKANEAQVRGAAAHYSQVQIAHRKRLLGEVADAIRKNNGRVAIMIDNIAKTSAPKAYDVVIADSFLEKAPQCATCGGLPRQQIFDGTIIRAIDGVLRPHKQPTVSTTGAIQTVGATGQAVSGEKFKLRVGTCYFCKRQSAQYANRAAAFLQEIRTKYPGVEIEEYDARDSGEITLGEVIIHKDGQTVLPKTRIYTAVVPDGLAPKK